MKNKFFENIAKTNDRCDTLIGNLAAKFHDDFIKPFCEVHNLRFWSGNGTWWFESLAGRQIHPEEHLMKWAHATGNSKLGPCRTRLDRQEHQVTCDDDDIPEFFHELREIEEILSSEVMGSPLGYSVSDFRTDIPCTRNFSFNERTRI